MEKRTLEFRSFSQTKIKSKQNADRRKLLRLEVTIINFL